MNRYAIISGNRLFSWGLERIVREIWPDCRATLYSEARAAICALRHCAEPPDLVLVDLTTEDLDGLDLIGCLVSARFACITGVVVSRSDERTLRALRQTRCDLVFDARQASAADLKLALSRVASGVRYVSASLEKDDREIVRPTSALLTPHQELILSVLGRGGDNAETAGILRLSPETVRTHRGRIMKKLGLQHKGELMRYAVCRGYTRMTHRRILHPGFELLLGMEI